MNYSIIGCKSWSNFWKKRTPLFPSFHTFLVSKVKVDFLTPLWSPDISIFVIYQWMLVTCISSKVGFFNSSVSNGSLYSMNPLGFDTTLPTPPGFAVKVLWVFKFGESLALKFDVEWMAVHLDTSSQRTRPQAYISILKKASLEKLMAPSNTSGAMYLRVPTLKNAINYTNIKSWAVEIQF